MKQILLTTIILLAGFARSQGLLTNLQACYPMNCASGGPILNAHAPTGSALNGSINGNVTCVADRNGNPNSAIKFGGTASDFVNIPSNVLVKPTTSLTVAGWFHLTSLSHQDIIFTKNNCNSNFNAYNLLYRNNAFEIVKKPGTGSSCLDGAPATYTAGIGWHHVVFYIDNTKIYIVVDNHTPTTVTLNYPFEYDSTDVILGGTDQFVNNPFSGSIDNLRFWNRQLTSTEITDLYVNDRNCEGLLPNPTALSSHAGNTENSFSLLQNSPNPFEETTSIGYSVPSDSRNVQIVFTNSLGSTVKKVDVTDTTSGTLNLDADEFKDGIYIYSLVVNGKTMASRKLVKH